MPEPPFVSVVIPCRNEAAHVGRLIDSVLGLEHPRERLEVVFVDGRSDDGTKALLEEAACRHPFIRVLDNPKMVTPAGLNIGILQARGEVIARMDAHSYFPPDYVKRCLALLEATGAGCAGGRVDPVPNGERAWARAVAVVTASRLGVGNSFRTIQRPRFVDTVPFGVFPRRVLNEVGLFDERLTRNQDNELSARIRRRGYKIAFDPGIRVGYWNQGTLGGLARQGFNNGVWNVYTLRLHSYTWTSRHFVPAAFVLYLAALALCAAIRPGWAPPAAVPLGLYAVLVAAVAASARERGGGACRVAVTVLAYHLSYGLGTHLGVANLVTGRWREHLGRPLKK